MRYLLVIIFTLTITGLSYAADESIELTTYYPAPYGDYDDLYVYNYLGIGTATPDQKLHVKTTTDSNVLAVFEADSPAGHGPYIALADATDPVGTKNMGISYANGLFSISRLNDNYNLESGGILFALERSTGNVGIGTFTPSSKLHVDGALRLDRATDNERSGSVYFDISDTKNSGYIYGSTLGGTLTKQLAIVLGSNSSSVDSRYNVDDNSRIVIAVNGDGGTPAAGVIILKAKDVKITSDTFSHPDYVFESTYNLESINEHADFMWKNKHLPALKSVKEIEGDGNIISLAKDRNSILEELEKAHIYIEQLHNRLKKVETKLADKE